MKIAQKFIWLISFLLVISFANAQSARHTSFDNRQTCNENNGIWREFGNGCGDDCVSKFDQYEICTNAITYGCDCGKGRCWHDDRCMSITSYKKIFDEESAEKEKLLEAKVKERQERIKNDPTLSNYLQNLYIQKDAAQNPATANGGVGQNQSPNVITQAGPQRGIPDQPPASAITNVSANNSENNNFGMARTPGGSEEIKIPPAFLQQEQLNKANAANTNGAASKAAEPAFPMIPLPQ